MNRKSPPIWDEDGYEAPERHRVIPEEALRNTPLPSPVVHPKERELESKAEAMADFRLAVYGIDCYRLASAGGLSGERIVWRSRPCKKTKKGAE